MPTGQSPAPSPTGCLSLTLHCALCLSTACRYYANWTVPRPESYREDVETALNATGSSDPSNPAAAALYRELASGAESGWDYSSRWFADNKTLATIRTTQVTKLLCGLYSLCVIQLYSWFLY
jgi:hypothetical protein